MIKFVSIFFILFLFFSCKKDPTVILTQSTNNTSVNNDTMLPLAVGNYWIYQMSRDDSSGTYTMLNDIDSLYIEKDSIISGELYYKFKHSNIHGFMNYFSPGASFEHIWMKDSLGYLITYPRMIALDPVHLRDTVFRISDSSGVSGYACLVPDTFSNRIFILGQYSGLWMKGYSFYLPPYNLIWSGQHNFYAYSKNIGLLRMRFFFVSCPYLCRFSQNLIRYHLN